MVKRFAKRMTGRLSPKNRDGSSSSVNNSGWYYQSLRPNSAGVVIDEVTALNLSGIWRAVCVKANDITKLPLHLYERLEKGGKRPDLAHKIYELLSYPNQYRTGRKQRRTASVHQILWGNSYQEIIRDEETGDPIRLELLDPRWVVPRRDHEGNLTYWLKGRQSPWSGKKSLLAENCIHFAGISLNGDSGLSPIQTNSDPLGTASALDKFAGTVWGNGALPNGTIECPPGWPDDARANFRELIYEVHGGVAKANRLLILEEGAKFVANSLDLEKLQMLSSREYSIVEIARILNMPPHKLYDLSHDVQRSLEEMNLDYYDGEIKPICEDMADEYVLKLLTVSERKRYFVGFDTSKVMLGTALTRAQTNQIKIQNGVITTNQWRAEDGDNPFDVDLRIMPLNMTRVDDLTSSAGSPTGDEDEDQPTDPEPLALSLRDLSKNVLREALRRMIRREILSIQKASKRSDFSKSWLAGYYSEHQVFLTDSLPPILTMFGLANGKNTDPARLIRSLIERSMSELNSSEDLAATLTAWEATKVETTIQAIEKEL
jgi:HK97 family phage portal protein